MTKALLFPMRCRMHCVTINEFLSLLCSDQNEDNHSIFLPDIEVKILLDLHGVTSYFNVRTPTEKELQLLLIAYVTAPVPE